MRATNRARFQTDSVRLVPVALKKAVGTVLGFPAGRVPFGGGEGRDFPVAGHPLVAAVAPCPVAGDPSLVGGWAGEDGLGLHGGRRLGDHHRQDGDGLSCDDRAAGGRLGGLGCLRASGRSGHDGSVGRRGWGCGDHMGCGFCSAAGEERGGTAEREKRCAGARPHRGRFRFLERMCFHSSRRTVGESASSLRIRCAGWGVQLPGTGSDEQQCGGLGPDR